MNIAINKSKETKDIEVKFNIINNKLFFLSQNPTLQLLFNQEITYDITCSDNINIWNICSPWLKKWSRSPKKKLETIKHIKNLNSDLTQQLIKKIISNKNNKQNSLTEYVLHHLGLFSLI